ncbi:MAG: adenine phosphoribosyltransferase [Rickettsiales bacterium]|jgi:adenine phosphoribosyltransferase
MILANKQINISNNDLRMYVRDVPDFPKQGILFRDISPLLREHFAESIALMADMFSADEWEKIDIIGGVESRGFIMAAGLSAIKGKGFVKIRKAGKLPAPVAKRNYGLEYGEDALEMQYGTGRMLIVDDVLATGGTLSAAAELAQETGHEVRGIACLINLKYLNKFSWNGQAVRTLIDYEA